MILIATFSRHVFVKGFQTTLCAIVGDILLERAAQKRLWPDTFVDVDHNLNTAIKKIREVLGDPAESPRFVETLPRRGYRFIAPIESVEPAPPPAPPRGRSLRVPILIGASVLLAGARDVAASAHFDGNDVSPGCG